MEQLIRSFTAWDERGNRIVLHEWELAPETKAELAKSSAAAPHLFRTSAGRMVNRLAKGQYQIAYNGAIVRSTDTDAP